MAALLPLMSVIEPLLRRRALLFQVHWARLKLRGAHLAEKEAARSSNGGGRGRGGGGGEEAEAASTDWPDTSRDAESDADAALHTASAAAHPSADPTSDASKIIIATLVQRRALCLIANALLLV